MKIHEMSLEQLFKGLIDPGVLDSLEAESQTVIEEIPTNVIPMPFKTYIQMSEMHAIDVHLNNLIETFGIEAVRQGLEHRK